MSRSLEIIGDRWSFLILREAFFGVRRFDQLQSELKIAPNILAERLGRLVARGVFERRKYQDLPERFEYRLTDMARISMRLHLHGRVGGSLALGRRSAAHPDPS